MASHEGIAIIPIEILHAAVGVADGEVQSVGADGVAFGLYNGGVVVHSEGAAGVPNVLPEEAAGDVAPGGAAGVAAQACYGRGGGEG